MLYRPVAMGLVVSAHVELGPRDIDPVRTPRIAAIALSVRDAAWTSQAVPTRGARTMPTRVQVTELALRPRTRGLQPV